MWVWLLCMSVSWGVESRLVPAVWDAVEAWDESEAPWGPGIKAIHAVWQREGVDPRWLLERLGEARKRRWPLPPAVKTRGAPLPPLALHAWKIEVHETTDDVLKDDVYAYFFVTVDGLTTGRVTGIHRHLGPGSTAMFLPEERALFPLAGGHARPAGTLHVDYGVVESDGDDVTRMRELTGLVIDLALAYAAAVGPQGAEVALRLRREVRALAEAIASLDRDDRLAAGSFTVEADMVPSAGSWREITRRHRSRDFFDSWDYRVSWRLMAQ